MYRSRCLRPVSRWSPLSHYIRLHRLGCTTTASTRGHCWSWSPPWGWTRPGVWAGLVWPELVCAECQGYMRPLLLCCCNLVSWSPTDCSLRPEAAAESSQLLPPPAALQHSPHSCHELHSEAANPITHNLAVPSIGTKSETRQGKYNRLNYFYGCSCGGNYSERMPRCFGGVL